MNHQKSFQQWSNIRSLRMRLMDPNWSPTEKLWQLVGKQSWWWDGKSYRILRSNVLSHSPTDFYLTVVTFLMEGDKPQIVTVLEEHTFSENPPKVWVVHYEKCQELGPDDDLDDLALEQHAKARNLSVDIMSTYAWIETRKQEDEFFCHSVTICEN